MVTGSAPAKTVLIEQWLLAPSLSRTPVIQVGTTTSLSNFNGQADGEVNDACLCCEGLPDLQEALEDLYWQRIYRKRHAFQAVVVDLPHGMDPLPFARILRAPLLTHNRYQLTCVVAVVGVDEVEARVSRSTFNTTDVIAMDGWQGRSYAQLRHAVRRLRELAPHTRLMTNDRCAALAIELLSGTLAASRANMFFGLALRADTQRRPPPHNPIALPFKHYPEEPTT